MPRPGQKAQPSRSTPTAIDPPRAEREDLAAMLGSAAPVVVESGSRLCTARLVLRPLRASDQRSWIQLVRKSRDDLDAFAPLHEPGESDEALFARQMSLTTEGEHTGVSWRRVAVLDDGSLIGCFNINSVRRGLAMEGDVNWWLGTPYQRKGLATEALGALIDYAFMTLPTGLGLDRLWASIQPGNERSKRLADRVGFCPASDGTDRLRLSGGHWTAHDLYAVDAPREPLTVLPQV